MKKSIGRLCDLYDSIKRTDIKIIEVPEEREEKANNLFKEIIAESFPTLGKELEFQIRETNSSPDISRKKTFFKIHYHETQKSSIKKEF